MKECNLVPLNTIRHGECFEIDGAVYTVKNRFYDTVFAEKDNETYRFYALQSVKYIEPFRDE